MYIRQEKIRFGNTVSLAFFHLASCLGMTCKEGINSTRKGKEKILKMTIYKHFLSEGKSQSKRQRLSDCEGLLQLIVVACDCMWPQSVIGFHPFYCFERKDNPTFIPGRSRYWYLLCKSNKSYSMTYQMAKSISNNSQTWNFRESECLMKYVVL